MERKKRSKGRGWESCYVKTIYGTFGVEMRAYGQKLVQFCTHTHTRVSFSSIDIRPVASNVRLVRPPSCGTMRIIYAKINHSEMLGSSRHVTCFCFSRTF